MEQYISKSDLVAEIEKKIKQYEIAFDNPSFASYEASLIAKGKYRKLLDILQFINTLEVKEVDLDGERRKYLTEHFNVYEDGILQSKRSNLPLDTLDVIKIANYFFELGMQVSNKALKGK